MVEAVFSPEVRRQAIAANVVRTRYAEDRLASESHTQYVILGAGLDSFAWRRPDTAGGLRVFEVDHPLTQSWKQERLVALGLPTNAGHVFIAADFEVETLQGCLDRAGFDWSKPTLFSWLGVAMYLTLDAVEAVLRTVATCAPRSEIAFTYAVDPPLLDEVGSEFRTTIETLAASAGEPLHNSLSPTEAEELVDRCGLQVADHPRRDDLVARYFAGRSDGLKPYTAERLVAAGVPG